GSARPQRPGVGEETPMGGQSPPGRDYKLVVLNEEAAGQEFALNGSAVTLGRQLDADVCLFWDPRVSRLHARLRWREDEWVLEDLGSTNGTYLSERRVACPTVVDHGDTIRVGRTRLEFCAVEGAAEVHPELTELQESEAPRPGLFRRAVSSLGRMVGARPAEPEEPVGDEPTAEAEPTARRTAGPHEEEPESPPSSQVACTIFPLSVDIRARPRARDRAPTPDELRATLSGVQSNDHAMVKIVQPLGSGDAWISVSAAPGHQGDLLILAGRVVNRLVDAGGYEDVALTRRPDGRPLPMATAD
ncbi:MAG: FHA domain-containing protein, partial [Armatimonadota bacterium]